MNTKHSLAKHIPGTPIAHLVLHSFSLHFHNAAGPAEPILTITYFKLGPNNEPLGQDRVRLQLNAEQRARLEQGGKLNEVYLQILTEILNEDFNE